MVRGGIGRGAHERLPAGPSEQVIRTVAKRLGGARKESPLSRYLTVLEAIASAGTPPGLSEVANICSLPLGSAHRLVTGLLTSNLIVADGTTRKTYRVSPRLLRLLHAGTEVEKIRMAVEDTLEAIASRLGKTCYLARLSGTQVISVVLAVPDRGVRYVFTNDMMPPHASASAKAIMAFQSPEFVERILLQRLEQFTPATKIDPGEILAEYAQIRAQGYAVCWNELEVGLAAVACPIELPQVGIIYALGVGAMSERFQQQSIEQVVSELRAALPGIEKALRHVSSLPPISARQGRSREEARLHGRR